MTGRGRGLGRDRARNTARSQGGPAREEKPPAGGAPGLLRLAWALAGADAGRCRAGVVGSASSCGPGSSPGARAPGQTQPWVATPEPCLPWRPRGRSELPPRPRRSHALQRRTSPHGRILPTHPNNSNTSRASYPSAQSRHGRPSSASSRNQFTHGLQVITKDMKGYR